MTAESRDTLADDLRSKRAELLREEIERVALELFHDRGFAAVTVDQIAAGARISVRTFYRVFPAKEDVLQVQIDRRAGAVKDALDARPADEPPLRSLRLGLAAAVAREDPELTRRWTEVVAGSAEVVKSVLGGITLKTQRNIAEFFAARLGVPGHALVPTTLAAAATGVLQSAHTRWYLEGGDLAERVAEGIAVLENGLRTDPGGWSDPSA